MFELLRESVTRPPRSRDFELSLSLQELRLALRLALRLELRLEPRLELRLEPRCCFDFGVSLT